jgi:hypothetical protein
MRIFGYELFEGLLQDPEERAYRLEREQKRRERVIQQCQVWELSNDRSGWDMIELPREIFVKDPPAKADIKEHKKLMRKQECHIFYGWKYCYHKEGLVIARV